MRSFGRAAGAWALVAAGSVQGASPLQDPVRAGRVAQEQEGIDEGRERLAISHMTVDRANLRRQTDVIVGMMQGRGIGARLLTELASHANPAVCGEVTVPGATRTVPGYAPDDGQPGQSGARGRGWGAGCAEIRDGPGRAGWGQIVAGWKSGDRIDPS